MIDENSLTIAVSTMYRDNLDFLNPIIPVKLLDLVTVLIINQTDRDKQLQSSQSNIVVINTKERGLAKSRNMAIRSINTPYAILTDDDVMYRNDLIQKLQRGFTMFPDAGVIKFKAAKEGDIPFNKYSETPIKNLSVLGIMNVSSIELVINISKLKQTQVFFDEHFGLGATFGNGLEQAFLDNVRKKKLQIAYYSEFIVNHPHDCSGRDSKSDKLYYVNGALARKIFGKFYRIWALIFFSFKIKQKSIKIFELKHFYSVFRKGVKKYDSLLKNENNNK